MIPIVSIILYKTWCLVRVYLLIKPYLCSEDCRQSNYWRLFFTTKTLYFLKKYR